MDYKLISFFDKVINKIYTDGNVKLQIQKDFSSKKPEYIVLQEFLGEKEYISLWKELTEVKREHLRIADKFSYSVIKSQVADDIFNSEDFLLFLSGIVGKKLKKIEIEVKEFAWKDYTLLHDSEGKGEEMKFFFFVLPDGKKWDYFWGGSRIYHLDRGKGKSLVFTPNRNTFCLIHKRKEDFDFMQYINHYAGNEKVVVVEGKVN